jgi:phage tail tape-measure protein
MKLLFSKWAGTKVGARAGGIAGAKAGALLSAKSLNPVIIFGVTLTFTVVGAIFGGEIFEGIVDGIRNPTPRPEVDRTAQRERPTQ